MKQDNNYITKKVLEKNYLKHKQKAERFYKAIKNGKKGLVINHNDMP